MFKSLWEKLNRIVSTSILCYLFLILLSFALVGIPLFFESNIFCNIITNFGYGIFGSTFVAILIDCSNTIRQRNQDQKEFFLLTNDLREAIDNLVSFRNRYNHLVPKEYRGLPYNQWIYQLDTVKFEFDGHETTMFIMVKTYFTIILEMAKTTDSKSIILANNLYSPDNFVYNLEQLIKYLEMSLMNEQGKENFSLRLGIPCVLENCSLLFPAYKNVFFSEWTANKNKTTEFKE